MSDLTLDQILQDDMFEMTIEETSLFTFNHTPRTNVNVNGYDVRKATNENHVFNVNGLSLVPFNGSVNEGTYFVLNGVTGFLISKAKRTNIIFENGNKSNMLYTSLVSMMRKNGRLFK